MLYSFFVWLVGFFCFLCSYSGHGAMLLFCPFTPFLWKVFCIKPMAAANLVLSNLIFFYIVEIFTESYRLEGSAGNHIVQPPAPPGLVRGPYPVESFIFRNIKGFWTSCLTWQLVLVLDHPHGENFPAYIKLKFHVFLLVFMATCPSSVHLWEEFDCLFYILSLGSCRQQ